MPPVDVLLLTKKRLQNLRRKRLGLEQLAVRVILKHLIYYLKHPKKLEKLTSLPGVLRDKILQGLMKKKCLKKQGEEMEFVILIKFFQLLLSPRTRYIELNGILSFCPDRYNNGKIEKMTQWCVKLLKQIETLAPEVETLVIKRNNPFCVEGYYSYLRDAEFNQEMVQSLLKMKKLKRLNVSLYCFNFTNLLKVCKNLPRLQFINVGLLYHCGKDQPAPEDVSSSLCNLKELIFEFPSIDWLGCLCTRNLPNIEVVEYDPNKIMELMDFRMVGNRHHGLDFHGASNLRHICVKQFKDEAKEIEAMPILFPKVTCLMVKSMNYTYSAVDVMPKFDNITQLHLLNLMNLIGNRVNIEKYLIAYGQKLQSLYLGNGKLNTTIDLEKIFKYCPKLEKLSLLNVCLQKRSSEINFFAELKELEWVFYLNSYNSTPDSEIPEIMVLSDILSAPKLEKVILEAKIFNQADLWVLNYLIENDRILNNLHTLHVYFTLPIHKGELKSLTNVMKSAGAFLPKLTDFKFGERNQFEDPLLPCLSTPRDFSYIDECVCKMMDVFENEK